MSNSDTTISITSCSSGDWVVLSVNGDEYFESLSNDCGCPELVSDEYNLYLQLKRKFES